ncbi:MAG: hypothetical protein F2675_02545 [Actinobacteria bacterium]|uniref:Unannotated protein n=1 Tax=freshwater metagenome TaxID=449393 RepID=A0A6J6PNJ8_9ZZZZ|nr:hypothetical protein [Actinomycetota bacterium]
MSAQDCGVLVAVGLAVEGAGVALGELVVVGDAEELADALGVGLGVVPGAAQGTTVELGVALADADGELVPEGAGAPEAAELGAPEAAELGAPEAAELGAADALLLSPPDRNGLNTSTVLTLGLCRKFSELMATAPKFGSGVIT